MKKVSSEKERELCPAENMRGLVTKIFYLGTIPNFYEPDRDPVEQVAFFFELDAEDSEGRRHVLSKVMTYSLHPKSTLSKWFSPILGSNWPKENEQFDITSILGLSCMVSVTHYLKRDGKTGAKINSISKLARGMEPLESDSDQYCMSYDDPQWSEHKGVPQWVRDTAAGNIETKGKPVSPAAGTQPPAALKAGAMQFGGVNLTQLNEDDDPAF